MHLHIKSDIFSSLLFLKHFLRDLQLYSSSVWPWPSLVGVWSASLFPVQTKSPQEETVFTELSAAQSEPCEVSRLQRHMFGISASIRIENSR